MKAALKHLNRSLRIPFNRASALKQLEKFHSEPRSIDEIVTWAMRFPSKGYFRVDSIQKRSEITALANAVAQLKPKNILEIGTARGGTLFIWSQLASGKVVSCDLESAGVKQDLYEKFPPDNSTCKVIHLDGDSHTEEFRKKVFDTFGEEKVDFLFIDGDHTEVGVEQDYNDYHSLVRSGGIIAFHDIIEKQALKTNQVYYFWKRLKPTVTVEEFVDNPDQTGYGIGIVRVK